MRISHLEPQDWAHVDPRRWQWVGRRVTRRVGRWYLRYRGYGGQPVDRVPASGGFLVAPNHTSLLDPFVFLHGFERSVRFMAKHQALEWPLVGRVIRWGGGFPVVKGDGRSAAALEVANAVLEAGNGLVIFMEGRIVRGGRLGEPRSGLARMALATGVPVVPVAAWGLDDPRRWWQRPKVTLVWGRPMCFCRHEDPSRELVGEVRDEIWTEVARLRELARELHDIRPASFVVPDRVAGLHERIDAEQAAS